MTFQFSLPSSFKGGLISKNVFNAVVCVHFTTLKSLVHEQGGYAVFLLLREYLFIRDFRVFKGIDFSKWGSRTLTTKENGLFIYLFDEEKLFDLVESWSLLKKLRTKFIENCIPFIMKKIVNQTYIFGNFNLFITLHSNFAIFEISMTWTSV